MTRLNSAQRAICAGELALDRVGRNTGIHHKFCQPEERTTPHPIQAPDPVQIARGAVSAARQVAASNGIPVASPSIDRRISQQASELKSQVREYENNADNNTSWWEMVAFGGIALMAYIRFRT